MPVAGAYLRLFGSFGVRRGESDREAVRRMREVVRAGNALGIFAEGTRQRSGVPGPVQPGAAMVALQEDVPVVCAAIYGSHEWRVGNFKPVSIAYGEPMRFSDLPRGAKGYREASEEIERRAAPPLGVAPRPARGGPAEARHPAPRAAASPRSRDTPVTLYRRRAEVSDTGPGVGHRASGVRHLGAGCQTPFLVKASAADRAALGRRLL